MRVLENSASLPFADATPKCAFYPALFIHAYRFLPKSHRFVKIQLCFVKIQLCFVKIQLAIDFVFLKCYTIKAQ